MKHDIAGNLESAIEQAMARGELDRAEMLAQEYRAAAAGDSAAGLSPRFRSCYLAAQVALAAGRHEQAHERLSELLPLPDEIPSALACRIELMFAEALIRLGQDALARGRLIRAEVHADALAENSQLKVCELRTRLWLGQVEQMGDELSGCDRALERRADLAGRTVLACAVGRAWDNKGRLDRAEECWTRAEKWSRPLGTDSARADPLIQLGRLDHLRGNHQAALDRYQEALACAVYRPQRQEAALRRLLVLLELSQASQLRADWEKALEGQRPEQLTGEIQPVARMVQALIEPASDTTAGADIPQARALYLRALEETASSIRRAQLPLALGMVALATCDGAEAKRWLEQAESSARKDDLPEVLWRVLDAQGRLAAEIEGDEDRARDLFERALVVCETQGCKLVFQNSARAQGERAGKVHRRLLRSACRRGDAAGVFRYLETYRGVLAPSQERPTRPALPELAELESVLPPGAVYIAPAIVEDECYLLVCRKGACAQVMRGTGSTLQLAEHVVRLQQCTAGQLDRHLRGLPPGVVERTELDGCLEELGRGCLGDALGKVLADGERIIWVPEGVLEGVPVHAIRRDGRYLIETHEIVYTLSGSFLVHRARSRVKRPLVTRALVLSESSSVPGTAEQESARVAGTFWRSRVLHGAKIDRAALRKYLPGTSVVHLACQARLEPPHPLWASIGLPSGEAWRAEEWPNGLPLVTLNPCCSAEGTAPTSEQTLFLAAALLGQGVRSVVATLWPIVGPDALPLMWRFYRELMTGDPGAALARAQREALRQGDSSPLFWAAFAFFGDPDSLPPPSRWMRWLACWRQRRHARRYSTLS